MNKLMLIVAIVMAFMLAGCETIEGMTKEEKNTALLIGLGTVIITAVIANDDDNHGLPCNNVHGNHNTCLP